MNPFSLNFSVLTKVTATDKYDNGYRKRHNLRMRERSCNCHKSQNQTQTPKKQNEKSFN